MCKIMDELIQEEEKRCTEKIQRQVAGSLSRRGMSIEDIAQVVEVSVESVRKWLAGNVIVGQ